MLSLFLFLNLQTHTHRQTGFTHILPLLPPGAGPSCTQVPITPSQAAQTSPAHLEQPLVLCEVFVQHLLTILVGGRLQWLQLPKDLPAQHWCVHCACSFEHEGLLSAS